MSAAPLPDLDTMDVAGLRELIVSQQAQLVSQVGEIEHLRLLLARLQRLQFGQKSEKVQRQIEQLELRLDELETNQAESRQQSRGNTSPRSRSHPGFDA